MSTFEIFLAYTTSASAVGLLKRTISRSYLSSLPFTVQVAILDGEILMPISRLITPAHWSWLQRPVVTRFENGQFY